MLTLRIGAQDVVVEVVPELQSLGEFTDGRIRVRGLSSHGDWLTLFHEALHALSSQYGLGLSEGKVRILEQGLGSLLRDNPDLLVALSKPKLAKASRRPQDRR